MDIIKSVAKIDSPDKIDTSTCNEETSLDRITESRVYYIPLAAYTYNEAYVPPRYGYARKVLRTPMADFKAFISKVLEETDKLYGGKKFIDNQHLYDLDIWCGFRGEVIWCKNGHPRRAKDVDANLKLVVDAVFEYGDQVGDHYTMNVIAHRVITVTSSRDVLSDNRHHVDPPYQFTDFSKKRQCFWEDHDDSFVLIKVSKYSIEGNIPYSLKIEELKGLLEAARFKEIAGRMRDYSKVRK